MSRPRTPKPGKLFLSILSSKWELFGDRLKTRLNLEFGEPDYTSELIPLIETGYYDRELGTPIYRKILTYKPLVGLERLADLKLKTNELEKNELSKDEKRLFNLDPGLLTLERLVLASGKNFTHRVYLNSGIWADLTLIFSRGDWMDLPWTFPDYASEKIKVHLRNIRSIYHRQLREEVQPVQ